MINGNAYISIQQNAFEHVVCEMSTVWSRTLCVNIIFAATVNCIIPTGKYALYLYGRWINMIIFKWQLGLESLMLEARCSFQQLRVFFFYQNTRLRSWEIILNGNENIWDAKIKQWYWYNMDGTIETVDKNKTTLNSYSDLL